MILTAGRFANTSRQAPRQHFNPPYDVPPTWITFLLKTNERTFVYVTLISSRKGIPPWPGLEERLESRERHRKANRTINLRPLLVANEKVKNYSRFLNADAAEAS